MTLFGWPCAVGNKILYFLLLRASASPTGSFFIKSSLIFREGKQLDQKYFNTTNFDRSSTAMAVNFSQDEIVLKKI